MMNKDVLKLCFNIVTIDYEFLQDGRKTMVCPFCYNHRKKSETGDFMEDINHYSRCAYPTAKKMLGDDIMNRLKVKPLRFEEVLTFEDVLEINENILHVLNVNDIMVYKEQLLGHYRGEFKSEPYVLITYADSEYKLGRIIPFEDVDKHIELVEFGYLLNNNFTEEMPRRKIHDIYLNSFYLKNAPISHEE